MKVTSLVLFVALGGGHFSWGKTPQRNRNRIKKRMRPGRRSRGERNRNQHNDDEHVSIEHVGHEYADDHISRRQRLPRKVWFARLDRVKEKVRVKEKDRAAIIKM